MKLLKISIFGIALFLPIATADVSFAGVARTIIRQANVSTPSRTCPNQSGTIDAVYGGNAYGAFNSTRIICDQTGNDSIEWIVDGEVPAFEATAEDSYLDFSTGIIYFDCLGSQSEGFTCGDSRTFTNVRIVFDSGERISVDAEPHSEIRVGR